MKISKSVVLVGLGFITISANTLTNHKLQRDATVLLRRVGITFVGEHFKGID